MKNKDMGLLWKAYKIHAEKDKRREDNTQRLAEWVGKYVEIQTTNKKVTKKSLT